MRPRRKTKESGKDRGMPDAVFVYEDGTEGQVWVELDKWLLFIMVGMFEAADGTVDKDGLSSLVDWLHGRGGEFHLVLGEHGYADATRKKYIDETLYHKTSAGMRRLLEGYGVASHWHDRGAPNKRKPRGGGSVNWWEEDGEPMKYYEWEEEDIDDQDVAPPRRKPRGRKSEYA